MRYYETMYLVNPVIEVEKLTELVSKVNAVVEKNQGVIVKADEWGKKSLAYKVKDFDKAYYLLLQYCGEPSIPAELHRELTLDDRVLKYQTIKLSDEADPEALKPKDEALESETKVLTEEKEVKNGIQ
jgi:small subunit ribosomal protein S6